MRIIIILLDTVHITWSIEWLLLYIQHQGPEADNDMLQIMVKVMKILTQNSAMKMTASTAKEVMMPVTMMIPQMQPGTQVNLYLTV